jgi:phage gp29-like protein
MNGTRFHLKDYNPLSGLDEWRLVSLLNDGERGAYATLQWLYRFLEKRNPTARAVKRRLLSAIGKLQWDIKTADTKDDAEKKAAAGRQAATLRAAYDQVRNLHAALQHLALAELRGFAHLEKIYARGLPGAPLEGPILGDPTSIIELRPVEQWFLCRDGYYGPWCYNAGAQQGQTRGTPLDPAHWIIRELDDPANEIIAKLHVRQEASDSDWDGYLERFGIPATIIEGPPNVPPEKEAEYQAMAEKIASDSSGYIPNGAKAHTVSPGTGSSVFKERLEFLDGQIVIAGTSGKLTILSESGSGTLAGGAQADAFADIAASIASAISGLMQEQFDGPLLAHVHPGEPVLAYFEFAATDEKDASRVLTDAKTAQEAGYEIDAAELSEKSGYKLTRAAAAAVENPAVVGAAPALPEDRLGETPKPAGETPTLPETDPAAVKTATAASFGVTPEYLAPAQTALDDLIAKAADGQLTNAELLASAEDFLSALPELAKKMDATGVAASLEAAMRTAAEQALQIP